jgi:hypothetical protein
MPPTSADEKEWAWWRIGVLDAERNRPMRKTPWLGVPEWESSVLKTLYLEGYESRRRLMERWANG